MNFLLLPQLAFNVNVLNSPIVVSSELMILDIILDLFFYEPPLFSEDYCFNPKKARGGGGVFLPPPTSKFFFF